MNSRRHVKTREDPGLTRLLELNGTIESQTTSGYWTKIVARRVKVSPARPFGIKYSLTLHSPYGERLAGFDNSHSVKTAAHAVKRLAWDHFHRHAHHDPIPYEYRGASQLLNDFDEEVMRVLKEVNDEQNN